MSMEYSGLSLCLYFSPKYNQKLKERQKEIRTLVCGCFGLHTLVTAIKGIVYQFKVTHLACSYIYPSRLFGCDSQSYGDTVHRDICLFSNDGTRLLVLKAPKDKNKKLSQLCENEGLFGKF